MRVHLYLKYDDLQKYKNGEVVRAADRDGKGVVFSYNENVLHVDVDPKEIVEKIDFVSRGMVSGTFNIYLIQKGIKY